jgi:hypothetical protein
MLEPAVVDEVDELRLVVVEVVLLVVVVVEPQPKTAMNPMRNALKIAKELILLLGTGAPF